MRKDNGESLLKAQNRFTICTDVQSKLVAKVCSLFVNLLMAMLLTGSFSVKSALYYRDSFARKWIKRGTCAVLKYLFSRTVPNNNSWIIIYNYPYWGRGYFLCYSILLKNTPNKPRLSGWIKFKVSKSSLSLISTLTLMFSPV